MGNIGSSTSNRRRNGNRNRNSSNTPSAPSPSPEIHGNRYVFAAATPYPPQSQNPNPNHGPVPYPNPHQFYQYANYYHPPPMMPLPGAEVMHVNWSGRLPCGPVPHVPAPYVEHQKAVTIRNDVNLKKETLRVEPDEQNPGRFLVSFTFDATVAGSISVIFFAKEGEDCNLTPTKPCELPPITISFKQGLGQKFRQPSGTGINFSMFDEAELLKEGADMEVLPLAVKAEATPTLENNGSPENTMAGSINSQITQAVFEKKESGEYHVRVLKQILWVTGMRYELQEIYGIGNSVESDFDGSAQGKECVICLSEQSDTTVLPCRHMCMCSGCAKLLRFQTNRCPICRQPVERLLEIKVNKVEE